MKNSEKELQKTVNKIAVFEDKKIRRIFHKGEWYFSIIDIVEILTGSSNPRRYWSDLKIQLSEKEGFSQLYEKIVQLKLEAADGKKYETDTTSTKTVFRIIQSIPSPKAEPFKRWLAQVGYERIQEIEDPELATKRTREIYKTKGYSDEWIEKRMRGIAIREELTDEWDKRGIKLQREYAILTAEISKATFLELIFSMLGEASTKEIAVNRNVKGFDENKTAAKVGGKIAGDARRQLEQESGKPVVSKENYLGDLHADELE